MIILTDYVIVLTEIVIENKNKYAGNGVSADSLVTILTKSKYKVFRSKGRDWNYGLDSWIKISKPFKRQPHEMVKHTQTICQQFVGELFECVWSFWSVCLSFFYHKFSKQH